MRKLIFWIVGCFYTAATFAQTPADTTIVLERLDVRGVRFPGLNIGEVKRLDVENNLTSIAGTTADAFRQLPSVVADMEGGVLFRGSGRSGILINNVPYGLLEEYNGDVLIQLPALFFNQLSVSSYPPVSWVPDGDAGLFNLASSLYTRLDAPVMVTLGAGFDERYNVGAVLNLHPGKWHVNAKYNYRHEYRMRTFAKSTTTATGTTVMDNSASAWPDVHVADLYAGYDLTPRDLVSVYGLYYYMDYSRYGRIHNTRYNPAGEVVNRMLRNRYNHQQQDAYAAEARWSHTFTQPDDQLEVVFNYNNFVYDEDNDFENENPQTGAVVAQDNLYIRQQKDNYYLSAAYHKPWSATARMHAGYIGRYRKEHYEAEASDLKEGGWVPNALKSDVFDFDRLTNLLFFSVEKDWESFSVELGTQAEWSRQEAAGQTNTGLHWYPRLRLAYQTGANSEWRLTYQQRVIRPYGADLNPFIDRADATHIKQGNPDLRDEYIQSLELTWPFSVGRTRMAPAVYYRYRSNRLMEVLRETDNLAIWEKANVGNSQTLGAELSVNWTPFSFLSANLSGDVYRDEVDGRVVGYSEKKSMVCWDLKGFLHFRVTSTTELQLDGFVVSDQLTPQGKIEDRSSVNVGVSQYFMQRKLRANLSVNNLFDSMEEVTLIHAETMQMRQVRNRDPRVTWLTLTYHF